MDCFAPTAVRLSGFVMAIAGWRPNDFWTATPQELESLLSGLSGSLPQGDPFGPITTSDLQKMQENFPDG